MDSELKRTVERFVSGNMERLADAAEGLAEIYTAVTEKGQEEKLQEILGNYSNTTPETELGTLEDTLDFVRRMTVEWPQEKGRLEYRSLPSRIYLWGSMEPLRREIRTIRSRLPKVRQAVDAYMQEHYDRPPTAHDRIGDALENITR